VRVAALILPIVAAVATSAILARTLPVAHERLGVIGRWLLMVAASTTALVLVERAARRLMPLATLLRLSIVFPDCAPSRLALARRAGSTRTLQRTISEARATGVDDQPSRAANRIITLMAALSAHDKKTRGHSERVRVFTDLIADELRLSRDERDRLRWAALLHDVGKLMLSSDLLNKEGKPSDDEWAEIHRHPVEGARIAAPLFEWLGPWAAAIEQHHERHDGRGYPHALAGREISLGARIVSVADAYERMTGASSYKKPISAAAARAELTRCAGTQFDPAIVRAFLNVSIGRLWWRTGPLSWLAQVPLLAWLPRLGQTVAGTSGQIGAAVASAGAAIAGAAALTVGTLGASATTAARAVPSPSAPSVPAGETVLALNIERDAPGETTPVVVTTPARPPAGKGGGSPGGTDDPPSDEPGGGVTLPNVPVDDPGRDVSNPVLYVPLPALPLLPAPPGGADTQNVSPLDAALTSTVGSTLGAPSSVLPPLPGVLGTRSE
jgi:hypothetical protein